MGTGTRPVAAIGSIRQGVRSAADRKGDHRVTRAERMLAALQARFGEASIEVEDESHLHAGHAGAPRGGESHYRVRVESAAFRGLSRIERHRLIHDILKEELTAGVHALALELSVPPPDPGAAASS